EEPVQVIEDALVVTAVPLEGEASRLAGMGVVQVDRAVAFGRRRRHRALGQQDGYRQQSGEDRAATLLPCKLRFTRHAPIARDLPLLQRTLASTVLQIVNATA